MRIVKRHPQFAAFILAGGISSRMGREKALLELGGVPLVVRTARLVKPLVSEVTIIGLPERYAALGFPVLPDLKIVEPEGTGIVRTPLVGIATALTSTKMPWNLILACDLPYLTADWLDWLLDRADRSCAQVVMVRSSGGLEPLAAAYRMECAAPIVTALNRGIRKVTDALDGLRSEFLSEKESGEHDPDGRVLTNVNSPADYEEAKRWLDGREPGSSC